ncbi:Ferrous iron transport protein A, partial [Dysosmobacter welbionis]
KQPLPEGHIVLHRACQLRQPFAACQHQTGNAEQGRQKQQRQQNTPETAGRHRNSPLFPYRTTCSYCLSIIFFCFSIK